MIRMGERIKIEKYAVEIDPKNPTKTVVYAIAGKRRYQMPDAYREMYTDEYLEIESRTLERPELYDAPDTHWIPRRTAL